MRTLVLLTGAIAGIAAGASAELGFTSQVRQSLVASYTRVFGSAARAHDFDVATSDADFLVEFAPDAAVGLANFFGAKADLEKLLGRGVDLVEPGAIRNPFVLASINRSLEAVYAA